MNRWPAEAGAHILAQLRLGGRRAVIGAVGVGEGIAAAAVEAEGVVDGVLLQQAGALEALEAAGEREGGGDLPQALRRFLLQALECGGRGELRVVAAGSEQVGDKTTCGGISSGLRASKAARNQSGKRLRSSMASSAIVVA
jgi:hypothetical protein